MLVISGSRISQPTITTATTTAIPKTYFFIGISLPTRDFARTARRELFPVETRLAASPAAPGADEASPVSPNHGCPEPSLLARGYRRRLHPGKTRGRRHHHTGEKLQRCYIVAVERVRCGRQHFENPQSSPEVAQRSDQDGAHAQSPATRPIHARIRLGVMAKQHFARAHAFRRKPTISLQADSDIRSGAARARPANNFVAPAQRDGSSGGAG